MKTPKLSWTALVVGALAMGGCVGAGDDDVAGATTDEVTARVTGTFLVRRDARRCAAPACGGYFVSPVNGGTARCSDGGAAASCYVADLDVTALALPAAQTDAFLRSINGSMEAPTVALHGHLTAGTRHFGRLIADEGWRAPTMAPLSGAIYRVSTAGTSCTFIPCASLAQQKENSRARPTSIVGVDVSGLTGLDPVTRDLALAAATTDAGVLVAGTQVMVPGNPSTETVRALRADQVFLRVRPAVASNRCGAELQGALAAATERLLYTSESDAPFAYFNRPGVRSVPTAAAFVRLVGEAAGTPVTTQTLAQFLAPSTSDESVYDLADAHRAARFRMLGRALESQLSNIRVFRVGTIQVKVYIVGTTSCGELAGLQTLSIET